MPTTFRITMWTVVFVNAFGPMFTPSVCPRLFPMSPSKKTEMEKSSASVSPRFPTITGRSNATPRVAFTTPR